MGAKWFYKDNKFYCTDKFGKLAMFIADGGQIGSNWSDEQQANPDRMLYFQRTHVGTITAGKSMTGMMISQTFKGAADSGNLDGIEIKSRGDSTNTDHDVDNMRAIVANVDVKYTDVSTTAKCIESVIEGNNGSTIAEARAGTFKIQSSGVVTASYVLYAEGHSGAYADYGLYTRYVRRPFYASCTQNTATNAFELYTTDSSTASSGYCRAMYILQDQAGAKTTTDEICALGVDAVYQADCPNIHTISLWCGFYSSLTMSDWSFIYAHADALQTTGAKIGMVHLAMVTSTRTSHAKMAFLSCYAHTGSTGMKQVIYLEGTTQIADYFIELPAVKAPVNVAQTGGATRAHRIACRIAGATYYLSLYTD